MESVIATREEVERFLSIQQTVYVCCRYGHGTISSAGNGCGDDIGYGTGGGSGSGSTVSLFWDIANSMGIVDALSDTYNLWIPVLISLLGLLGSIAYYKVVMKFADKIKSMIDRVMK